MLYAPRGHAPQCRMLRLERLSVSTAWKLGLLERDPSPTPWGAEVERIVLGSIGASHLRDRGSALLLVGSAGEPVGAVLHYPHEDLPGMQYLAALLIDHRYRGEGLGRMLLSAAINDARDRSGRSYVGWVVHGANAVMLHLSSEIGDAIGTDQETGYRQFVDP